MWKVLQNVHFHGEPLRGVHGMSAHGGATTALYALKRRGLVAGGTSLNPHYVTEAGKAVLAEKKSS